MNEWLLVERTPALECRVSSHGHGRHPVRSLVHSGSPPLALSLLDSHLRSDEQKRDSRADLSQSALFLIEAAQRDLCSRSSSSSTRLRRPTALDCVVFAFSRFIWPLVFVLIFISILKASWPPLLGSARRLSCGASARTGASSCNGGGASGALINFCLTLASGETDNRAA